MVSIAHARPAAVPLPVQGIGNDRMSFLRDVPLFSDVGPAVLSSLAPSFRKLTFRRTETIFRESAEAGAFYVIRSGWVKLVRSTSTGRSVVLELRGSGELVGTLGIALRRPYTASAVAAGPVELLALPASCFFSACERYPELSRNIWREVGGRFQDARESLTQIAYTIEARIAQVILRLAARMGEVEGERIHLPKVLTRQDIADMVGTTVETVIRTISRWKKQKILDAQNDQLVIRNAAALADLAQAA